MRKLLVLCFFLFLTASSVHSQSATAEPADKWWWAWRESTGEVIAFDAGGDTHVIAKVTSANRFSRINADTALAVLDRGDTFALYKLTPSAAMQLGETSDGPFDPVKHGLETYKPVEIKWPLAVLTGSIDNRLWIVNLETNSVERTDEPLSDKCDSTGPTIYCLRFSEEGRYIRYAAKAPPDVSDVGIALRERDLLTGVEHDFYRVHGFPDADFNGSVCTVGVYGEHWLCRLEAEFKYYEVASYWLVDLTGHTQPLIEQSLYGTSRWNIFFSKDNLIILDGGCSSDCFVDVYASDGQFQRYDLPDDGPVPSDIFYAELDVDEDLVVFSNRLGEYAISSNGEAQVLGKLYCCHYADPGSPDGRWIALYEGSQGGLMTTAIWDLETNQRKFRISNENPVTPSYKDDGFIAGVGSEQWLYFNGEEQLHKATIDLYGSFTDILPNHKVLYEQWQPDGGLMRGVYQYDPANDSYMLLIPNATLLFGT